MEQSVTYVSWYLPTLADEWRGARAGSVAQLIALNRPEAVVEVEEVDFDVIMAGIGEVAQPQPDVAMADVMAAISSGGDLSLGGVSVGGEFSGLIDDFLGMKDLKIVAENEGLNPSSAMRWETVSESDHAAEEENPEELISEQLAQIYLDQQLYAEAKEIYTRLFLLYSEKSVYFASRIGTIDAEVAKNSALSANNSK